VTSSSGGRASTPRSGRACTPLPLYGNSRLIDERRERAFQAGLRLLPTAAVYVDLSYGRAIHNGDRWYTLGLGAEF
jgi:hypothetical protein